jgi:hypothetical protein
MERSGEVIQEALDRFAEEEIPEELPASLPLLEDLSQKLNSRAFENLNILFIQHHLGPFIPRIQNMRGCGLEPSKCWFIDIPYSTNERVLFALAEMDCPKHQMVDKFNDPIAPYSRRQKERVDYLIRKFASQKGTGKLLVIDDGAYFVRTLQYQFQRDRELVMQFKERGTFLVEQTTRGHRYLLDRKTKDFLRFLNIPAVSVARTNTKYDLESPFIGAAVARAVKRELEHCGRSSQGLGRVLIIGFGAVGRATTVALLNLHHDGPIDVYDKDWKKHKASIEALGARPLKRFPKKGSYATVCGCTGYASFPVKATKILAQDALLISGSSAAIEFNREKFIDLAYERDDDDFYVINPEKTRNAGIHATIQLQRGDKRFSFLNAGFPVNFDGRMECLPPLIIQITHGLLLAACQETLNQEPGFHELSKEKDHWLSEQGLLWIEKYASA